MSALSPSSYLDFSFNDMQSSSNSSMVEDSNATIEDSNAMDLFRYYLDLQQQQQQQQPQQPSASCSQQQALTPTINMAEIEQSQSGYNSNSLFPFADASPSAPPPASLPPAAFAALPAGSELPLQFDPSIWTSFMSHATGQVQQEPKIEETEPVFTAQLPQMPASELPVAGSKKRARSSQPIAEAIQEEGEHEDDVGEDHSDNDDEDDEQNDASFGSTSARTTRSGRNTRGTAPVSTTKSNKRAVSVASSSTTSSALPARPAKKAATSSTHHHGQSHPHALVPVPEWDDKLSKAEYDKLSSKEKRQMRNKISARNFRHRRKAHIDTLEAEIQDKNVVISVLQDEVGALRTENTDLRADIEMLKKNWESIAAKISMSTTAAPAPVASTSAPVQHTASIASTSQPALSPDEDDLYGSASLPALSPPSSSASTNGDDHTELSFTGPGERGLAQPSTSTSASASTSSSSRRTTRSSANTKQPKPNLRKDLSSATGNGFWDSTSPFSSAFRGFGAGMDVHTTLVPDFSSATAAAAAAGGLSPVSALSEKRENGLDHFGTATFQQRAQQQQQQQQQQAPQNMNPALNALSQEQISALREQFGSSAAFGSNNNANNRSGIDGRDRARLLAGKDNLPGGGTGGDKSDQSFFEANPFLLLRGDSFQEYRGQLYAKLANNAAGIAASSAALKNGATSPPEGLKPSFFSEKQAVVATESEMIAAGVAAIAQKTLFEKLSTAFWDAFSGQSGSGTAGQTPLLRNGAGAQKHVDGKKVADVLSGKSRLQVVPNVESVKDDETGLENALEKLALRK